MTYRELIVEILRERVETVATLNKTARLNYRMDSDSKGLVVGISVKLGTNLTPQDIDVQATAESTPGHSTENTPDSQGQA